MKYRCLRNCFINGQIYLKGEEHVLPDSMKENDHFQPLGHTDEPDAPEKSPERPHKHHYRKDGTCSCGEVLSQARMKKRELKAKKAKTAEAPEK